MAIFKALTFDGVNSLDYGIYITGEAVYNAPERAVEMVNIPGKNGALALDQGRFENIEVTYHAGCFADNQADFADKVMQFRNALASRYTYKRLTDEYHPDEYRLGLYKSGLDVDAVRYGTAGEFNIVFDCKPQRFLVDGDRAISPTEWSDVQTAAGELVTIESDGSLAVKSLEVSLSPIQDLNGYDKPWVGGAGKNLIPYPYYDSTGTVSGITRTVNSDGSVTFNGTATATVYFNFVANLTPHNFKAGSYIFNVNGGEANPLKAGVSVSANVRVGSDNKYNANLNASTQSANFTPQEDGLLRCYVTITNGTTVSNLTIKPMIRLASVSDASYEPYENICPISGRTEVVTHRVGKNFIPYPYRDMSKTVNGITSVVNDDGSVVLNGMATANVFLNFCLDQDKVQFEKGSYILSSGTTLPNNVKIYANVHVGSSNLYGISVDSNHEATMNAQQSGLLRCYISITSGATVNNLTIKPMLRLASDADNAYEPYNGNTYTTALGRTVYGGTLDVVSGVLTVDTMYSSTTWSAMDYPDIVGTMERRRWRIGTNMLASQVKGVSNIVPWNAGGYAQDKGARWYNDATSGFFYLPPNTAETTAIEAVFKLATPQTYQLTPQQIDLLLGTNHLFSDGEITVEYGVHPYYNPTPFDAKPLIKVTGRGTLGIGEYILTITGTATQTLYIDCETMEIYTIEGTVPTGASSLVSINKNDFPVLEPGTNNISVGSGITAVTITPRWWRI